MNKFVTAFLLAVVFSIAVSAQSKERSPYMIIELDRFTIAEGVEFPENDLNELMSFMMTHFNRSRRFEQVFFSTDTAAQTADARRAKISGVVTKYSKGSRAARYIIGMGAGRTKLVADITVADAETGDVLFKQRVDGHVYGGLFGGETDGAKGNLTSDIIKSMTKQGWASKKRLR